MEYTLKIREMNDGVCEAFCPELGVFTSAPSFATAVDKIRDMILLVTEEDDEGETLDIESVNRLFVAQPDTKIH